MDLHKLPTLTYLDDEADICTLVAATLVDMLIMNGDGPIWLFAAVFPEEEGTAKAATTTPGSPEWTILAQPDGIHLRTSFYIDSEPEADGAAGAAETASDHAALTTSQVKEVWSEMGSEPTTPTSD